MNAVSARMTSTGSDAVLFQQVAVPIHHPQDVEGLHANALIRKHRIRARHLEQRPIPRAERDRQIRREILLEPESFGQRDHVLRAEGVHHLDRRHVARFLEGVPQRNRAFERVVVVVRAVDLPVAGRIADRRVEQNGGGREPPIDRGGVDDRLERRPELPVGLDRAVELAPAEAPAADHRSDLARPIVDGEHRAFDSRRLLERRGRRLGRFVELHDRRPRRGRPA